MFYHDKKTDNEASVALRLNSTLLVNSDSRLVNPDVVISVMQSVLELSLNPLHDIRLCVCVCVWDV